MSASEKKKKIQVNLFNKTATLCENLAELRATVLPRPTLRLFRAPFTACKLTTTTIAMQFNETLSYFFSWGKIFTFATFCVFLKGFCATKKNQTNKLPPMATLTFQARFLSGGRPLVRVVPPGGWLALLLRHLRLRGRPRVGQEVRQPGAGLRGPTLPGRQAAIQGVRSGALPRWVSLQTMHT